MIETDNAKAHLINENWLPINTDGKYAKRINHSRNFVPISIIYTESVEMKLFAFFIIIGAIALATVSLLF